MDKEKPKLKKPKLTVGDPVKFKGCVVSIFPGIRVSAGKFHDEHDSAESVLLVVHGQGFLGIGDIIEVTDEE